MLTRIGILKRLGLVTLVLLAGLNWVAYVEIEQAAGSRLLDLRPLGYSADEVRAFLAGLTSEVRDVYARVYLILDTGFIAFSFALLCTLATWLKPRRLWWLVIGFAALFGVSDLAENWLVTQLIREEPVTVLDTVLSFEGTVRLADLATRIKFAALLLALAAAIFSFGGRSIR